MELIMFGNNRQLGKCMTKEIRIGEDVIQRVEVIKILVVKLDKNLFQRTYIGQVQDSDPQSTQNKKNKKFTG